MLRPGAHGCTWWDASDYWSVHETRSINSTLDMALAEVARAQPKAAWIANLLAGNPDVRQALTNEVDARMRRKEEIFEEWRTLDNPTAPSRRSCMFLFDDCIDPAAYATRLDFKREDYHLVEVRLGPGPYALHRAKQSLLNCNAQSETEMVRRAREYWKGAFAGDEDSELLFSGFFTISAVRSVAGQSL